MSLVLVPPPAGRGPRFGIWVKISLSLIAAGLLAITFAVVLAVRWYYGLSALTSGARESTSISMGRDDTELVDEQIGLKTARDGLEVDLRQVSVRLGINTAEASVDVQLCRAGAITPSSPAKPGASGDTCQSPVAFHPGPVNMATERILVRISPRRAGSVVIEGVSVSYRKGVRSTTQQLGRMLIVTVKA